MSLDLDKRQRAMLREMGVRIWQPPAPAVDPAPAENAINKIAVSARPERAEARFDTETAAARSAPAELTPVSSVRQAPAPGRAPTLQPASALQPRPAGVALMDWPALQAAVASCRACALCQSRKNTTIGVGRGTASFATQNDTLEGQD